MRYTDDENPAKVVRFLLDIAKLDFVKDDAVAAAGLAAFADDINSSKSEGHASRRFYFVQDALSFVDLLVSRRPMVGKSYDVRHREPGYTLPDGNVVSVCPVCGKGCVMFYSQEEGDHAHAVHILQAVSLTGVMLLDACCVKETC